MELSCFSIPLMLPFERNRCAKLRVCINVLHLKAGAGDGLGFMLV